MGDQLPPLTPDVASQIAKADPILGQNQEPGFANTYGPGTDKPKGQLLSAAIPAMGMGALSLYLLYRQQQQDKLEQEAEKEAKVDLEAFKAQLPGLHAPDLLLGGAAGAGAGALYDYVRGAPKGKKFQTTLKRMLTGAALGAGATNLAGDRLRRYISNSMLPFGYDSANALDQLKPRSLAHVRDALIYDKPSYDPKAVAAIAPYFASNKEILEPVLNARRELHRIGYGVHSHNPATSAWQKNQGGKGPAHYSLNEKNPEYLKNLRALMLPTRLRPEAVYSYADMKASDPNFPMAEHDYKKYLQNNADVSGFFKNPQQALARYNVNTATTPDMFGSDSLLGAQQLVTRQNGQNTEGLILDRHDVTPTKADMQSFLSALLGGRLFNKKWQEERLPNNGDYNAGQTNIGAWNSTLKRLILDRALTKEHPWVSQKFRFTPDTPGTYGLEFLKQDGQPAMPAMTQGDLYDYLNSVQGQR
jgi:hypothetical protein